MQVSKLCQLALIGKAMREEWKTNVITPIFKGKGDVMRCESYKGVKLLLSRGGHTCCTKDPKTIEATIIEKAAKQFLAFFLETIIFEGRT